MKTLLYISILILIPSFGLAYQIEKHDGMVFEADIMDIDDEFIYYYKNKDADEIKAEFILNIKSINGYPFKEFIKQVEQSQNPDVSQIDGLWGWLLQKFDRYLEYEVDEGGNLFAYPKPAFHTLFWVIVLGGWFLYSLPRYLIGLRLGSSFPIMAFIPGLQGLLEVNMAGLSIIWFFALFIPMFSAYAILPGIVIIPFLISIFIWSKIAERCGHMPLIALFMIIPIFYPIMPWYIAIVEGNK